MGSSRKAIDAQIDALKRSIRLRAETHSKKEKSLKQSSSDQRSSASPIPGASRGSGMSRAIHRRYRYYPWRFKHARSRKWDQVFPLS